MVLFLLLLSFFFFFVLFFSSHFPLLVFFVLAKIYRVSYQGYARSVTRVYPGPKVGRRRALSAVIELLLCWLVSRTYKLYCSGSKVALGLSLRARLLAPPLATAARKYLRYANYDA